jgi:multidrug resistance efflux pump
VSSSSIFREEALRSNAANQMDADVLRISPAWSRWAYWLLVAAFTCGILYGFLGSIYEYASAPAVVWISGRTEVTATVDGTVSSIEVRPGQKVEAGALLVRFHAAREIADLERLQREFDLQLIKTLRDPSDAGARETLTSLRTQKDLAVARVEQLSVRAPQAGVIGDVRIRPGQLLSTGEIVLTLVGADTRVSIVAMVPAHYRPQLRPGMSMRFEVTGYRYAYLETNVESVGAQIIGPNEVQKYLGQEIADTVKVTGPVVLVEARPPSPTFQVDDQTFDFYHGMNGIAETRIRSESLLVSLAPSLRVVFDKLSK